MSQQYNKTIKKRRREAYLKRKKAEAKTDSPAKTGKQGKSAKAAK